MQQKQDYCLYYQAHIQRKQAWFFVAVVRSYEHVMFDRTLDTQESIFEFFVPADTRDVFLSVMNRLEELGIVTHLHQLENRLALPNAVVS